VRIDDEAPGNAADLRGAGLSAEAERSPTVLTTLDSSADGGGHPLAPYVPRLAIEWITSTSDKSWKELAGTIAFVDISGFTALSESLERHGKRGAEELTATISSCFASLLDLAIRHGGRLLKFGGDALLVYFSGEGHEARACCTAIEMRRTLRAVGRLAVLGQKVSLRISVGIHSGMFHFFLVGRSHREFIVTGPGASSVVAMESAANAGEIVISNTTAAALKPGLLGERRGPGTLLLRAPDVPPTTLAPLEPLDPALDLSSAVPIGLRSTLSTRIEPEHRRVTAAFVHFDGTDDLIERTGPEEAARRLDALVTNVQRAVERQGVTFLASDVDRDGGKIILTAGAPSSSGDDEQRMLLAVREIMDSDNGLPIRIGVNQGSVFVGDVGPPYRRTFTVMADAINLAARLMAKASPGEILTTPDVLSRSQAAFEATELEPFFVKGKTKSVCAMRLGHKTHKLQTDVDEQCTFVGRREELRLLESLAAGGQGALVEIVGATGVGKSRLAQQLRQITADRMQLGAVCERYDSATPYYTVRRLLRGLLDLPAEGSDASVTALFLAELERRAPELRPWAPLIGMAIDVTVPETRETQELDEEFRRAKLAEVVIALLAHLLPSSGLITIEDTHNMDEASADLLGHLARAVPATGWLWCLTRRDVAVGFIAPDDGPTVRVELEPLSEAEATQLALASTRESPVSDLEIKRIVARSGGNPLFVRELVAAVVNGDSIDVLPDSIEDVVVARIDRLSAADRGLLRRMSVLGQSFGNELLADVVDDVPDEGDPTWSRLDAFVVRDAFGNLVFRNALLRDSAYNGLSFRLRHELHSRAADSVRRTAERKGEENPELLSFHYLHAQRFREAWTYSLHAAERARGIFANIEAAEYFERAIEAGGRLPEVNPTELAGVHEALGDARNLVGNYVGAAREFRFSRRLIAGDSLIEARLLLKLARVEGWLDRYTNALRWITRGLKLLDGAESTAADRQRAELLGWYGRFCQEGGKHRLAIKWCTQAVEQAELAGDKETMADALRIIDWANMDLGKLESPANWERALRLFEEIGNLPGQAGVLNMLGGFAYFKGEWDEAEALYRRAQATVRRTGNAVMDAFYVFNIGEIALDQGRLDDAEQAFESVWRTWRAARYRAGAADARGKLARVRAGQGRYEEARELFESAIEELVEIGSKGDALEATARLAECLLLSGDFDEALAVADRCLDLAHTLGGVPPQIALIHRVRGAAMANAGDVGAAIEALGLSLTAARRRGAEYEAALTLRVIAECDTKLRLSSEETMRKLLVLWTPELVPPSKSATIRSDVRES
jgi:class 3 adenylate cyclase/tetratricopeptide (TPR) repeat protein